MSENISVPEEPRFTKEQVITAFQKFIDKGVTHPDDLPLDDPEVIVAEWILDSWAQQEQKTALEEGTIEAKLQYELDRTTIMVDAGFSDPDYLDEVANDWLQQIATDAEREGSPEMVAKIDAKVTEIEAMYKKI